MYEFEIEVWALPGDGEGPPSPLISWQPYRDTIEYIGGKDWSAVKYQFADR